MKMEVAGYALCLHVHGMILSCFNCCCKLGIWEFKNYEIIMSAFEILDLIFNYNL